MKTVFDQTTREELIKRIQTLNDTNRALWGKMNVYQMLKHCTLWEDMILGKTQHKRVWIGRLLGKTLLKNEMKDEGPMKRNTPTIPEFRISETGGDIETLKSKWISQIEAHAHSQHIEIVHPFFGKMTAEQIGYHAYKHNDHHLRQFNA